MLRQKRPMAEIVREAVYAYVTREPRRPPPGAGAFASGGTDTAQRIDDVLEETQFGTGGSPMPKPPGRSRPARARKRS
jgi:hypothetical protein